MKNLRMFWIVVIAGDLVLFAPAIVFACVGIAAGMAGGDVVAALAEQFTAPRLNLLEIGLLSLAPVALLTVVLAVGWRLGRFRETGRGVALGGSAAIFAIVAGANWEFWSSYLPERVYPGWPHGVELIVGPLVAAPVGMVLGMVVGHRLARR